MAVSQRRNEVNRTEIVAAKVFYKLWEPLGNESLQLISKRLCECWLLIEQKKSVVLFLLYYYFIASVLRPGPQSVLNK